VTKRRYTIKKLFLVFILLSLAPSCMVAAEKVEYGPEGVVRNGTVDTRICTNRGRY
jgi:hypothetical protein